MNAMIDFNLPFPWCAVCKAFAPEVEKFYGADKVVEALRYCEHADFCQNCGADMREVQSNG